MSRIHNKKSEARYVTVEADDVGRRIDNFLMAQLKGVPRSRIYQMLRKGEVRVNKGRIKQTYRLLERDVVRLPPVLVEPQTELTQPPEHLIARLRDSLIFEDDNFIAINKPGGLVVHSGSGRSFGVIEILRHLRPTDQNLQLVHRIDQDTSGCLLLSKNSMGLRLMHDALRAGATSKRYIALLSGDIGSGQTRVDSPLKKNILQSGERRVRVDVEGKPAVSIFKRRRQFLDSSLVDISIKTGRTHQIRVHAEHIGHAVCGDDKYADKSETKRYRQAGLRRLFLHASELSLPSYGKSGLHIRAPLADDLAAFIKTHE